MSEPCPLCNGSTGRTKCVCGGTGKLVDAYNRTAELYLHERNQHEETKFALAQLQKAVLGFIFHPEFKKSDRNGFFRRYWEDKLEMKMTLALEPAQLKQPAAKLPVPS